MPKSDIIVNLPKVKVNKVVAANPVRIYCCYTGMSYCPHCRGEKLRKKDKVLRTVRHQTIGMTPTELYITLYKYHCLSCGKYFRQRIDGLKARYKGSEQVKQQLFELHMQGVTTQELAVRFK